MYVWLLGSGKDDTTGRLTDTTFRMLNESMSALLDDDEGVLSPNSAHRRWGMRVFRGVNCDTFTDGKDRRVVPSN